MASQLLFCLQLQPSKGLQDETQFKFCLIAQWKIVLLEEAKFSLVMQKKTVMHKVRSENMRAGRCKLDASLLQILAPS